MIAKFIVMVLFTEKSKGDATARKYSSEAALSLRSRRNGTKFAAPLLAELLIKYQRLPRGLLMEYFLASADSLTILLFEK